MNTWLYRWSTRWALPIGLALNLSLSHAQTPSIAAPPQSNAAPTPQLQYHSVLTQYQQWRDQPVAPWAHAPATEEEIDDECVDASEDSASDEDEPTDAPTDEPVNRDAHSEHRRTR